MHNAASVVQKLVAETRELFESMVMMDIVEVGELRTANVSLQDSITGMVGLAGSCKGVVAIHVPVPLSLVITGNFLGTEILEMDEDVEDAIGEIANMLGGNVKAILAEEGCEDMKISLPSTIAGENYTVIPSEEHANRVIIPFSVREGSFLVEVEIEA